jgi:hypothetical protein
VSSGDLRLGSRKSCCESTIDSHNTSRKWRPAPGEGDGGEWCIHGGHAVEGGDHDGGERAREKRWESPCPHGIRRGPATRREASPYARTLAPCCCVGSSLAGSTGGRLWRAG